MASQDLSIGADDGTRWIYSPEFEIWNGFEPGEDGLWELSPDEMERQYPEVVRAFRSRYEARVTVEDGRWVLRVVVGGDTQALVDRAHVVLAQHALTSLAAGVAISQHEAAVVCHHFGRPGGYEGSGFTSDLVALMARADLANLRRLGLAYPGYAAAVALARGDLPQCEELSAIAQGGVDSTTARAPARRTPPPGHSPMHRPLEHQDVDALAESMFATLRPAMLVDTPDPLVSAAWMAAKAVRAIGQVLDPSAPGSRADWAREIADCAESVRQYAHRHLATEQPVGELAAGTMHQQGAVADMQALVDRATVVLGLPDTGDQVAVDLTFGIMAPTLGSWAAWSSDDVELPDRVDPYAHLEIAAALAILSERLSDVLLRPPDDGGGHDETRGHAGP